MVKVPSSKENAHQAPRIFEHFGTRPGEGILPQNILAVAVNRKWRMDDIREGLSWGLENGWV